MKFDPKFVITLEQYKEKRLGPIGTPKRDSYEAKMLLEFMCECNAPLDEKLVEFVKANYKIEDVLAQLQKEAEETPIEFCSEEDLIDFSQTPNEFDNDPEGEW